MVESNAPNTRLHQEDLVYISFLPIVNGSQCQVLALQVCFVRPSEPLNKALLIHLSTEWRNFPMVTRSLQKHLIYTSQSYFKGTTYLQEQLKATKLSQHIPSLVCATSRLWWRHSLSSFLFFFPSYDWKLARVQKAVWGNFTSQRNKFGILKKWCRMELHFFVCVCGVTLVGAEQNCPDRDIIL